MMESLVSPAGDDEFDARRHVVQAEAAVGTGDGHVGALNGLVGPGDLRGTLRQNRGMKIVSLLLANDKEALTGSGVIRQVYDPAAGTGGMLSIAEMGLSRVSKPKAQAQADESCSGTTPTTSAT